MPIKLENGYATLYLSDDGRVCSLVDKRTGKIHGYMADGHAFARVKKASQWLESSTVIYVDRKLHIEFGDATTRVTIGVMIERDYFLWEIMSVDGEQIEELMLFNLQSSPDESTDTDPFVCSVLALNLQTNVVELPGVQDHLQANCYRKFGFAGARLALIGCPRSMLRAVLQDVVSAAPEVPHSPFGGPWALDAPINRGSYLFNFGDLSEETVDDWIRLAHSLGMTQIDFHGGVSFRFGDCHLNPQTYPRGRDSMRAVIDKLHAAGIAAGLHTYAFLIDKTCPWVTPVPDPRLGKDAIFTLEDVLTSDGVSVPVVESTAEMSTITGFFVRNSVTLQIDDELIIYGGISKESPFMFTECQRGAYGTQVAEHAAGTPVHHLKECFNLFAPDEQSTLFTEIAATTADTFNNCGFDMMYLDALDAEDILGGTENGWHYGSKFVFEIWKRLRKPALVEMSTFHHHLWFVRSRIGAWDHPVRSYKRFVDLHCSALAGQQSLSMASGDESQEGHSPKGGQPAILLPGHLGWWAILQPAWGSVATLAKSKWDTMFTDDIEYLCCKSLATDTGFALQGADPSMMQTIPVLQRFAQITQKYERLRHTGRCPVTVKARLRESGEEFTLIETTEGELRFLPVDYAKHKVGGRMKDQDTWQSINRFGRQPLRLRIEGLMSVGPYDAPGNVVVADISDSKSLPINRVQRDVTVDCQATTMMTPDGQATGCFMASNTSDSREATWAAMGREFSPLLNLGDHQGFGFWLYGDGQGEVLNVQVRSPEHISGGIEDHYVVIDFTGWRYIELVEPEGERFGQYRWPYGAVYNIYRETPDFRNIEWVHVWYNNLPAFGKVMCHLSPIKALPLVKTVLTNPSITVGGRTVTFPVAIQTGCYLEYSSDTDCKLFGAQGELLAEVTPIGETPIMEEGLNEFHFTYEANGGYKPRAEVTVIGCGDPIS